MKHARATIFAVAALLMAQQARSTPPDAIDIEDRLFAASPDTVFVLRTTTDNLGLYTSMLSESFLMAIDVETGSEISWLVYRARRDFMFDDDSELGRLEIEILDREDWHDPYAIIADAGAVLAKLAVNEETQRLAINPADGDTLSIAYMGGQRLILSRAQSLNRLNESLAQLSELVADTERMAPIATRTLYRERQVDPDSCAFLRLGWPVESGSSGHQLVRVTCGDGEGNEMTSLIQLVGPD